MRIFRVLEKIIQWREKEMKFISGPRQVGKTFIAREASSRYFNWDTVEVKKAFQKNPYFFRDLSADDRLVVFDEIHKRRDWKKLLKGYFDSPDKDEDFLVTGSGRFDQYRRGGDSLQGRYFAYVLWPLCLDEICVEDQSSVKLNQPRIFSEWAPPKSGCDDADLIKFGGFPLAFIKKDPRYLNRWNRQYLERLVKEDVLDFAALKNVDKLELMVRLLPERITSPVSEKSLGEDVEVSPITIKNWLRLLNVLYFMFPVNPFSRKIQRSVKKEKKWYFYQWNFDQENEAARFENYMAVQLSLTCSYWTQQGFGKYELYYLRDQDRREVDFVITKDLRPVCLVETKLSDSQVPASLKYYCDKLNIPGFLVYPEGAVTKFEYGYKTTSSKFLKGLVCS